MTLYLGSCHCGRVRFEFEATLTEQLSCDCTLCRKRNARTALVERDAFRVTLGSEELTQYRWNTGVAAHHFCRHCGIYVYHDTRTQPERRAVNLHCVDSPPVPTLPVRKIFGSMLGLQTGNANG